LVTIVIDNIDLASSAKSPLRATKRLRQLIVLILNHRVL
jgi:hypothetical protein